MGWLEDGTAAQLDALTSEEYIATVGMDINAVIEGTTEAGRLISSLPDTKTFTIRWEQSGADVIAANTAAIVVLQFAVLKRIDGRRRTRVLALMATIWAGAWGILAATGWAPGGVGAVAGVVAFTAIFGFGETMMQATMPSIVNDLADDHSRGRANSVNSAAFQLGAILGPVVAGFLLHHGYWVLYVLAMLTGCALVALPALILERLLPPAVNGVPARSSGGTK